MKKNVALPVMGLMTLLCLNSCSVEESEKKNTSISNTQLELRGEYLVKSIGCGDCHSPKIMTEHGPVEDTSRRLSGYNASNPFTTYDTALASTGQWTLFNHDFTAAAGPWGVSFAANLTPDLTGIGGWTPENFKRAIREGKYKGLDNSRPLLPPMPWEQYRNLTDEDIEAIFSYLKTIKPVENRVPSPIPPRAT